MPPPADHPKEPEQIGDFRILRTLGVGGMGIVYEAEQDHPRRRVALKVVRAASLTSDVLKRFEREAHVLGMLQHPGIAQIYQAGTVDRGSGLEPYFAMELVQGSSLLAHALERDLTLRQKLELLARVCDALQHAHEKGVVHRDLKPGNILVVPQDGQSSSVHGSSSIGSPRMDDVARVGQPKILDFGLARLIESDLSLATIQTQAGQILGTVQYMSPEQVSNSTVGIDSRSDVYALGVIGFELVSGRIPYEFAERGMLGAMRTIREDEPRKLSSIHRALRGDVETIVAKALEKDPSRRYPSAADMAADIRRFLKSEPIIARPPSAAYQLRKFAARNKALVGGIAAVFVALAAGLIGTSMGYVEARRNEQLARDRGEEARQRAEEALRLRDEANRARDEATEARAAADASAAEAQAINDFLVKDLLFATNPNVAMGRTITLEQVLEGARARVDDVFQDQPLLSARLHYILGELEFRLGRFSESERHYREALTLNSETLGPTHGKTLSARQDLGRSLSALGRHSEACELLREVVAVHREKGRDGELASALTSLGQAHYLMGDAASAQAAYDEALAITESIPEEARSPATLPTLLSDRGTLFSSRGLYEESDLDYQRALELFREFYGDMHPDVARVLGMLAGNAMARGRLEEASTQLEQVLAMQRELFEDDHPDTARTLALMSSVARSLGDYGRAEALIREAIAMRSGLMGFDEIDIAKDRITLSDILTHAGRYADAAAEAEQALDRLEKDTGVRDPKIAEALFSLALARRGLGDTEGAGEAARRSLEIRRGIQDLDPKELVQSMSLVAQIHHREREYDQAEPLYREVRAKYEEIDGPQSMNLAIADANLGQLFLDQGKLEDAEASLRASVKTAEAATAPDHPTLAALRFNLARVLNRTEKRGEAIDLLHAALSVQRSRLPPGHSSTLGTLILLGETLVEEGRADEAEPLLREALEACRASPENSRRRLAAAAGALGACLFSLQQPEEAEAPLLESHQVWTALADDPAATARAAERLAKLYEALGRGEDAEMWRTQAIQARGSE